MSHAKSYPLLSDRCRVCAMDLRAAWARAESAAESADWMRQILEGACDACQRLRYAAAMEFIHAADAVRVAWQVARAEFGDLAIDHEPFPQCSQEFRIPVRAVDADRRCRELGIWAQRQWRLPVRLRP